MKKSIYLTILSFAILFIGCETEDELIEDRIANNPIPGPLTGDSGSADFSKYVALGNSLAAGFMDGALYNDGQANSFPAILAQQLSIAGGGAFNQPDINSEDGYNTSVSDPANGLILGRFILDTSIPGPVPIGPGEIIGAYSGNKAALNNFGVPGILTAQFLTPFTGGPNDISNPAFNPFYERFASDPGNSTILGDALAAQPSFITLWAGSNDVLGYAVGGAADEALFTDEATFEGLYTTIVSQILDNSSANGVLITIPPVTGVPFFRAVPYNPIPLEEAQVTALTAGFTGFNQALDGLAANQLITTDDAAKRKVTYTAGPGNPILIIDEDLEDLSSKFDILLGAGQITTEQRAALQPFVQSRPATGDDLVVLNASLVIGEDLNPAAPGTALKGISVPMGDEYILTPEEQAAIQARTLAFNQVIGAAAASDSRFALLDINEIFLDLLGITDGTVGIEEGGQLLQPDFSPNGIFSTDGVHPNPRGNALIANEVIKTIEASFGADIPKANVLSYRSVIFQ